ncbi:MAG TPA: hypothetical protein VGU43_00225 [Thermoplasmata archaeon]|nr:hypothetical protein [Thermoplasmata archaeon]
MALLVAFLAAPSLGGVASATPVPASGGGNTTQWAYGAQENVSFTVTTNGSTYSVNGQFGYQVIFTRTNTSNSTYLLESQRTVGFNFTASFCSGTCGVAPSLQLNLAVKALEQDTGFANVTTQGSVTENGTAVPAVAIQNVASQVRASLTESLNAKYTLAKGTLTASQSFNANLSDSASVQFTPALGLLPTSPLPTAGDHWNASTTYAIVGSAHGAWASASTGYLGTSTKSSFNISGSDNASGSLTVYGRDLGTITLRNGETLPVIALTIAGPFAVREGTIWVPSSGDLWAQTQGRLQGFALASIGTSTDRLDVDLGAHGHLELGASATGFSPAPVDAASKGAPGAGVGVTPASQVPPPPNPTGTEVQAQPETVAQAQSASNCLVNGCGSGGHSTSPLGGATGLLLGIAGLAAIAALIAALVVSRRRAPRPPAGPTTAYPAMVATPPAPTPPVRNGSHPPNSGQNDPLGNLY